MTSHGSKFNQMHVLNLYSKYIFIDIPNGLVFLQLVAINYPITFCSWPDFSWPFAALLVYLHFSLLQCFLPLSSVVLLLLLCSLCIWALC